MNEAPGGLSYRHWFFISLLALINVIVFGCLVLAVMGKMYFG